MYVAPLRLRHRGPDWSGVHVHAECVLAHERLAIVDVLNGSQPLFNATKDVWLAVNGEIYNSPHLRAELTAAGASLPADSPRTRPQYETESDCECILHMYVEAVETNTPPSVFLNRINGIFAFVLTDERKGTYLAARDHMGIIPLSVARAHAPGGAEGYARWLRCK
jgi:asparagine synthase (glutamine-hydrolysing)